MDVVLRSDYRFFLFAPDPRVKKQPKGVVLVSISPRQIPHPSASKMDHHLIS
jgi:hypothetical protein